MNFIGINAIKALYYTTIINGVIAVPLIYIIIRLANDERIVGEFKSDKRGIVGAWFTFSVMGISSILMIIQLLRS